MHRKVLKEGYLISPGAMWKNISKLETNDFTIRCNSVFYSKINIIDLNTRDRGKY